RRPPPPPRHPPRRAPPPARPAPLPPPATPPGARRVGPPHGSAPPSAAQQWSYRRHPVAALCESPLLGPCLRQSSHQLVPQPLGLDDGVDHEVRCQSQHVDVGLVLGSALGHEGRPLSRVL